MQLETLLNHVQGHKGFVYDHAELHPSARARLVVRIWPDARCQPRCSKCKRPAPHYDTQDNLRHFQLVPPWGLLIFLEGPTA